MAPRTGVRTGQLLGRIRQHPELAIDAFVVAAADLAGGAIVSTTDPDDLERSAVHASRVRTSLVYLAGSTAALDAPKRGPAPRCAW